MKCKTQGRLLIERLKRKAHTYGDMLAIGISTSPWRRIKEALQEDERVDKGYTRCGLITWRVVKVCR